MSDRDKVLYIAAFIAYLIAAILAVLWYGWSGGLKLQAIIFLFVMANNWERKTS